MEIVLIVIVFVALLLGIIWVPFFKVSVHKESDTLRDETNVELYKEHKAEIEKDFSAASIDKESYHYLLAELDKSLLQDIGSAERKVVKKNNSKQFSVLWPVSLSLFIIVFSVALYLKQGTLNNLMATDTSVNIQGQATQGQSVQEQKQDQQAQILAYIKELQQHISENPEDAKAWYNLGKTLVSAGGFDLAINAFEQVIRIEGEHADLLGAIAQASYYRNNQQIDIEIQTLIDRALALDSSDPSTNILLGMDSFMAEQYQAAINYWQIVIKANRPDVNVNALQEAVNEANNRLSASPENDQLSKSKPPSVNEKPKNTDTLGPQLKLNISLSADISKQLADSEDKVVFVYAIPTDGKRMPLAALKLMASDLPKTVTLNNNNAMSAENNLSSVKKVHIYAIVSQQGGAGIKPGDFKAEIQNIAVDNKNTINLVIDSLVE